MFGHGLLTPRQREVGEGESAFLVLLTTAFRLLHVTAPAQRSPCFWIFPLQRAIAKAELIDLFKAIVCFLFCSFLSDLEVQ